MTRRLAEALDLFSPPVREWFTSSLGSPTRIQEKAWPRIAAGEHLLVSAPTGSGKTLTAFLWAIDRLVTGAWEPGSLRVLYVSPLRALGNDIQRNLLLPLAELPRHAGGRDLPTIRVETRSGDTPQSDRRKMLRSPPEILITTPESLNILLTSAGGRRMLTALETVILDEVHAVVASKRGIHLISAVERLTGLCGEFQRVALSATVRPQDRIARWLGGYRLRGDGPNPSYEPRPVSVVRSTEKKRYELEVHVPVASSDDATRDHDALWKGLAHRISSTVHRNRSTLIFGNSRRMVEKVARLVNETAPDHLAYSHHGSLSREIRAVVEERLKAGSLKAIVATNSLELGIDIGAIDEIAMVQPPPSVASTVQRLGRSGHRVGELSRGRIYALHRRGLIGSAVLARAAVEGEIEPIRPVTGALDVLAQVVLSMTVPQTWKIDDLFAVLRCSDPYHDLPRRHFDLVLDMLAGRYASTRVRSLRPLIRVDGIDDTVRARPGVDRLVYQAGGTIPDRGYFQLRMEGSGSPVGELDEEFVWERSVGDTFTLGVQTWRIQSISHNDVFVTPAGAASAMAPFWRAEEQHRSFFLSDKMARFLEWCAGRLDEPGFADELTSGYHLQATAAADLHRLLEEQVASTGSLPHRHLIVEEHTASTRGRGGERQVIIHTLWGGRVNRPFAEALAGAWAQRHGSELTVAQDDDCIVLSFPASMDPGNLLELVRPEAVDDLLTRRLSGGGFFGARFREAAGCALLLPRSGFRRRTPLWLHRQRAKELLEAVSDFDDFPMVLEAWRSCLQDEFDVVSLKELLTELREGQIDVLRVTTDSASPFASHVLWKQTNELMYEDDTPDARLGPGIRDDLLKQVALTSSLRPMVPRTIVAELTARLQRTAEGYSPASPEEVLHWLVERIGLPVAEWRDLLDAVRRDHEMDIPELVQALDDRVVAFQSSDASAPVLVCAVEAAPRVLPWLGLSLDHVEIASADGETAAGRAALANLERAHRRAHDAGRTAADSAVLLAEWLRFYGPISRHDITTALGLDGLSLDRDVADLADEQTVVVDRITDGATADEICDRENLERLLRMVRTSQRPRFEPVPVDALPVFLARHQGVGCGAGTQDDLQRALESLFGFPAPAELWETEILPARIDPYISSWLDALLSETELRWLGCGNRRVCFALDGDRELFLAPPAPGETSDGAASAPVFPEGFGRYPFYELQRHSSLDAGTLTEHLWQEAWEGRATTDSFAPVRSGVASGFAPTPPAAATSSARSRRRLRMDRWTSGQPSAGNWFTLAPVVAAADELDAGELVRDRVRLLLDRYGILCKRVLDRETEPLRWSAVFRTLRLMELSGEVVAGHFIDGVPGLHFASHRALRTLAESVDDDHVWWINAADPASPCGLGLEGLEAPLPKRLPSNHLVFHGRRIVVLSEARGARLTIRAAADHSNLPEYLDFLKVMLTRPNQPMKHVTVATINEADAATSEYRAVFDGIFHVTRVRNGLRLSRRY